MDKINKELPVIAILMAVYEPRLDWLEEQLKSLNAQTYPNLYLFIRDDCSPTVSFESIRALVQENVKSIPYVISRNSINLGSNNTFALLTAEASGEYYAYCDQDDIWLPEKLSILQEAIEREHAELVCSDMVIIDADGRKTAESITEVRRRHIFKTGENLAPQLIVSDFVTGCTMLMRAETSRAALPFCPYMIHDHYLAFYAAINGKIVSLPDKLVQYRLHGNNQSAVMAGVKDRESYFRIRIRQLSNRVQWLLERFGDNEAIRPDLDAVKSWITARERNFRGEKGQKQIIWKYRRYGKAVSLFEVAETAMSEKMFMICIRMIQKGIL